MTKNKTFVSLDTITPALVHISKFYSNTHKMAAAIGVDQVCPIRWLNGEVDRVSTKRADKVLELYEVYKDQEPDPEDLVKSVWFRRAKTKAMAKTPGGKLRPLEVGKSYKIKSKDGRVNDQPISGRVVQDLGRFYLVDCGNYKSTILKNDLCKIDFDIEKV